MCIDREFREAVLALAATKLPNFDPTGVGIEVSDGLPRTAELGLLERVGFYQDYVIFAVKNAWQVIKLVGVSLTVWGTIQFMAEFVVPGTLPGALEVARLVREGVSAMNSRVTDPKSYARRSPMYVVYREGMEKMTEPELQAQGQSLDLFHNQFTLVNSIAVSGETLRDSIRVSSSAPSSESLYSPAVPIPATTGTTRTMISSPLRSTSTTTTTPGPIIVSSPPPPPFLA